MIAAGEFDAPIAQVREALLCSHSPRVILRAIAVLVYWLTRVGRGPGGSKNNRVHSITRCG